MSNTTGTARNLNESRNETLQALRNVSNRLGEILNEAGANDGTHRNEHGEMVNEEGLPIVDISEPMDDLDTPSLTAATDYEEEDQLPRKFSQLSAEARNFERQRRDKILQLLEEEERREEERSLEEARVEHERQRQRTQEEMQKRMLNQGFELEKRRKAREIEKKMAKALVGGFGESEVTPSITTGQGKKKSVSFAEPPSGDGEHPSADSKVPGSSWGAAVAGRVPDPRAASGQPLKFEVVEKRPPMMSKVQETAFPSDPPQVASPSSSSSPESSRPTQRDRPSFANNPKDSDDESDMDDSSDSTATLASEDEDAIFSAQHHRVLALEYHRRREALATSAESLSLEDKDFLEKTKPNYDNWEQEDVPLEATLVHPPDKPPISRFKASLLEQTNLKPDSSSTFDASLQPIPNAAFGSVVLPPDALANSIRMGKFVDGKLIASPADEEEVDKETEEEEEIRKLLLKSMEDYAGIAAQAMGFVKSPWIKSEGEGSSVPVPPPQSVSRPKPKASRFKVNRAQGQGRNPMATEESDAAPPTATASATVQQALLPSHSDSNTPVMMSSRSSPKMVDDSASRSAPPMVINSVSPSYPNAPKGPASTRSPIPQPKAYTPASSQSMIIDSPSFMSPSTVIDSPSFPVPSGSTMPSFIVDSPSFPPPTAPKPHQTAVSNKPVQERKPPTIIPVPTVRPSARNTPVADTVRERVVERNPSTTSSASSAPKRISRFKAERSEE